jgi:hypothetical protein
MKSDAQDSGSGKVQKVLPAITIPLFSGRPKREIGIGHDDLVDLDILLHSTKSVEEFLAKA